MKNIGRRQFIKTTAATALAAPFFQLGPALASPAAETRPTPAAIPKRRLGRTGYDASIFALGGQSTLEQAGTREQSLAIINRALDLGVNYIDTAEAYGNGISETYIGEVMRTRRNEVFLATKTRQRTIDGIEEERFPGSCKRLQTNFIDLYFMHVVNNRENLHAALNRDNGAVLAFENLKEKGRIGNIGISSHSTEILEEALDLYDFDCIFLTINPAGLRMNQSPAETRKFLKQVAEKDVGVIAMKLAARNELFKHNISMQQSMTYALSAGCSGTSYPISTAAIGITRIDQVEDNYRLACNYSPCDDLEMDRMEAICQG